MCSEGRKSTEIYAFVEETLEERRERTMYTNVCKHCHQVFRSKIRTCCCKDCRDKDEDQLDDIVEYLHRFPSSNALQFSEELGIHPYVILKYMEEGWLSKSHGTFSRIPD